MNNVYSIIIVALSTLFTEGVMAQNRFKATVMGGLNMSQIDGDKQQGYRKPGLSLGLNGSIFIRPNFDISTELLYNQKGAKPKATAVFNPKDLYSTLTYHYSEVALLGNYYFNPNNARSYYKNSIHIGFSYGRILKSSIKITQNNLPFTALEADVSKNYDPKDFSFIVGWSQLVTPRIGFTIRHTSSINFLYKNSNYDFVYNGNGFEHLRPYFLSFQVFYNMISPNKVMGLRKKKGSPKTDPLEEL